MEPEQEIKGLSSETGPGLSIPAHITLPLDIKTDIMTMYLVTRDKLERIKGGTSSDESALFGLSVGVCLTIASVLISLHYSNVTADKITLFLWALLLAFAALAVYFGRKWYQLRTKSDQSFNDVLEKSATVVSFAPKQDARTTQPPP